MILTLITVNKVSENIFKIQTENHFPIKYVMKQDTYHLLEQAEKILAKTVAHNRQCQKHWCQLVKNRRFRAADLRRVK